MIKLSVQEPSLEGRSHYHSSFWSSVMCRALWKTISGDVSKAFKRSKNVNMKFSLNSHWLHVGRQLSAAYSLTGSVVLHACHLFCEWKLFLVFPSSLWKRKNERKRRKDEETETAEMKKERGKRRIIQKSDTWRINGISFLIFICT